MTSKHDATGTRTALLTGVLGMAIAGFAGPGIAQAAGEQSAPSVETPAAMQKLQAKRQEIRQLTSELRQIQEKATDANPKLAAEQQSYHDLVMESMKGQNFDPERQAQSIRALQSELRGGGDLGQEERQAKMQKLRKKTQQFRSRQQQAMQTEDVRIARETLDKKMQAAMEKQNPEVAEMIAELTQLQREYQNLLQETMQQQGGGQAPQG